MRTNGLGLEFPDSSEVARFCGEAGGLMTLLSVRFESVTGAAAPGVYADLTLYNGEHLLVLLALPCEVLRADNADAAEFSIKFTGRAGVDAPGLRRHLETQVRAQWGPLCTQQGTPYVNALADVTELPDLLDSHPIDKHINPPNHVID